MMMMMVGIDDVLDGWYWLCNKQIQQSIDIIQELIDIMMIWWLMMVFNWLIMKVDIMVNVMSEQVIGGVPIVVDGWYGSWWLIESHIQRGNMNSPQLKKGPPAMRNQTQRGGRGAGYPYWWGISFQSMGIAASQLSQSSQTWESGRERAMLTPSNCIAPELDTLARMYFMYLRGLWFVTSAFRWHK